MAGVPDPKLIKTVQSMTPATVAVAMQEAEGWRPEKGDELDGAVIGVKLAESSLNEGRWYPIVFLAQKDDAMEGGYRFVAWHASSAVSYNEVVGQQPERGDWLYVKSMGPKEGWEGPKGYKPPVLFAVAVIKEGGAPADPYAALKKMNAPAAPVDQSKFQDEAPF
jgi:hypothetical protein